MMKHLSGTTKIYAITIISSLMLICITLLLGFQIRGRVPAVNEYDTFEKLWNEIDTLESHGLTKTALEKTTGIYILAKKSGNSPQIIKSLIYQIKYKQILEEGGFEKALSAFEEEIREAEFPEKNILQSAAAELYWNYYQQNRWRFSDRTHTLNFNQDDISTWDLRKLTERVTALYEESLTNVDSLKQLPIDLFASILIRGDMPAVSRPTLYDFLAHRALDHFMNDEPYIIQPSYRFNISGYEVFAPAKAFMDLRIETRDSTSGKLLAINILQNLLQFHKDDPSPDALIDIELKRFQFLRNKSIHDLKDSLYLHGLIDLETVYGKDSASAAVSFAIAQFYFDRSAEYAPPLINDNQWDKKQALDYCIKVITHFPSTSAVVNCKALQQLIEAKNILLTVEQVNTPNQPFRGLIEYRNVNQIFFRVIKDPDSLIQNMRQPDEVKKYEVYLRQPILQQWSQPVVDLHDFQQHATEIKIPALPLGRYIILGSSTENFSIYDGAIINAGTTISNISYIRNRNKDSYSFYILDRETGQPLRLAKARILTQFYESSTRNYQFKETGKYTADENGYFELPVSADNQNFRIEFSHGEDILMADDHFYLFHQEGIKEKIIRTVFFTDRAIFRPGQTIYFKGIMLQSDGGPNELMTKFSTTVELYDMNGQKIQSQNLVTNEYGSFIGTFTAPSNGLKGEMTIRNIFGSTSISVEEYKRPRFEVLFDTLKGSHRLNDIVNVGGMAKSYAGANLDGATVNYRVVRQGRFPIWNYGYRQSHPNWISNEMEIVNGQTKAGADGSFKFSFTAIPDLKIPKKESPVFDFKIIADVVDISGETHTSEAFISIGYISLNANVLIPETVSTDFLNKFEIITTNLNGIFEAASGTLNVYPLDEPDRILRARLWKRPDQFVMNEESFHKIFPYDVYDNEDDFTSWPRGHSVLNQQFNTALDRSFILPKTIAPGKYLLELIGKDKYGEELKVQKYFTSYSSKDKHIPLKTSLWATQLPDTATNIHTVHFYAGSAEKDMTVIYEIRSKDFVKNKLLKWQKDGIHDLSFMISPDMKSSATITILTVRHGRVYSLNKTIAILADEKNLKIDIGTFRNKLLPGETEEWSLKITGSKGEAMAAEMVASLYDASLDAFRTNTWNFEPDQLYYPSASWTAGNCFGIKNSEYFAPSWNINGSFLFPVYDQLNWFGFNGGYGYLLRGRQNQEMFNESAATEQKPVNGALQKQELNTSAADAANVDETREQQRFQQASVRKNLQETAFFYPQLQTDGDGNVIIKFTMPEALTRWKFLAFAHTKDLRYGMISNEILTQKDLMVVPNAPRFFREGDEIFFSAKVTNLSEADITGSVILQLYDAITMKPIDTLFSIENRFQSFNATKKQSVSIFWKLRIPSGVEAVDYKVIATAGNQSDGEEDVVPILSDKIFVTETLPLNVRGNSTKNYSFSPLLKSTSSSTLKHYNLTLEFTGNPMWYAIQALPYLMEYPYQSSEQTFNRFYSNALASNIATSNPIIKQVFDQWKSTGSDALLSNLEKNQELKSLFLQETPWLLQARDESARKKNIALLFDINKTNYEMENALRQLEQMQLQNGGWSWFSGGPDDRYITQYIVAGFGHLHHLNVLANEEATTEMLSKAIYYLDDRIREDYEKLLKSKSGADKDQLNYTAVHYLYTRSFFPKISLAQENKKIIEYYQSQSRSYWNTQGIYAQGMIALAMYRSGDKKTAEAIIRSLKENAIIDEELGMYWKSNRAGYFWYEAPIEIQALMIEAFHEIMNDSALVENMKLWLLKQKQTNYWKSTKATAEAVYALLLHGNDEFMSEPSITVSLGKTLVDLSDSPTESGTGYFKKSWNASDIISEMGHIKVSSMNSSRSVSWGSVYWQYFEQSDKITNAATSLSIQKKLFLLGNTESGPMMELVTASTELNPGDVITVRIELHTDRNMEYIHLKDMRAAGLEPLNVLSQYKWQDGLGYYEETEDAATNFFIDRLPKGTYIFEYPLRVQLKGDFSNGITTIQCMYAPEFSSHSEGVRVKVK